MTARAKRLRKLKANIEDTVLVRLYRRMALRRQGFRCFYCLCPLSFAAATGDHLIPRAKGGKTILDNIKAACFRCNQMKGARPWRDFLRALIAPTADDGLDMWLLAAERKINAAMWRACTRIAQANGADVGNTRVKRTTIRKMGPHYQSLLVRGYEGVHLHHWWKSRTPFREKLGEASLERIGIERVSRSGDEVEWVRIEGRSRLFEMFGAHESSRWLSAADRADLSPLDPPRGFEGARSIAYADGFTSLHDFAEFFVPNLGDRFEGVVLKW